MSHEDERDARFALEMLQFQAHGLPQLEIERRKRFVEQQDAGTRCERTRQRDTLLLAAGQLGGLSFGKFAELDEFEHLLDGLPDLARRLAEPPQSESDVLGDTHVREEGVVLEDRVDVALVRREILHVLAEQQDFAAGRHLEAGDEAQHGRLAAARRPQQGEELVTLDGERNLLQCRDLVHGTGAERLHDRLHFYGCDHCDSRIHA